MTVGVMGAGAFGTALAISLAGKDRVDLWARSESQAERMRSSRTNARRLPGAVLPDTLHPTAQIRDLDAADPILLAIPMQQLRGVLGCFADALNGRTLVACCKGIEIETGLGPLGVIAETLPRARTALLTGPSFAADIARGLPTALTLACADEALGKSLQQSLNTDNIRLYRTTDTVGAELGGALKNVVAIACGAVIGAGLGDSARAAVMTRGFAEMQRMASKLGARRETLSGLSGFGDLALTCTSEQSRNYRLGLSIGTGAAFDPSVTVEGAATARAVDALSERMNLEMPITRTVCALLDGETDMAAATADLLARPLKEE